MKNTQFSEENLYYTTGHEWIRFLKKEAFIGISNSKIAGTKKIKKIAFVKVYGFKKKGEVFATIELDFQQIDVHMPVDGTITKINNVNNLIDNDLLLLHPEMQGWLAKITIAHPLHKDGLSSEEQYTNH